MQGDDRGRIGESVLANCETCRGTVKRSWLLDRSEQEGWYREINSERPETASCKSRVAILKSIRSQIGSQWRQSMRYWIEGVPVKTHSWIDNPKQCLNESEFDARIVYYTSTRFLTACLQPKIVLASFYCNFFNCHILNTTVTQQMKIADSSWSKSSHLSTTEPHTMCTWC